MFHRRFMPFFLFSPDDPASGFADADTDPSPDTPQDSNGDNGKVYSYEEHIAELKRVAQKERDKGKSQREKQLLDELGVDSFDDLKSRLEAQESQKSELASIGDRLAQIEKERDEARKRAEKLAAQRKSDEMRDSFLSKATGARDKKDLFAVVQSQYGDAYAEAFDEDGKADDDKLIALVQTVRQDKPHLFGTTTPGIPSNSNNGQAPELNKKQQEQLRKDAHRRIRRYT